MAKSEYHLLPCPFCGRANPTLIQSEVLVHVQCVECGAKVERPYHDVPENAVPVEYHVAMLWNDRKSSMDYEPAEGHETNGQTSAPLTCDACETRFGLGGKEAPNYQAVTEAINASIQTGEDWAAVLVGHAAAQEVRRLAAQEEAVVYKRMLHEITMQAGGCPGCEYDDSDGGLFRHCDRCQNTITNKAWIARGKLAEMRTEGETNV